MVKQAKIAVDQMRIMLDQAVAPPRAGRRRPRRHAPRDRIVGHVASIVGGILEVRDDRSPGRAERSTAVEIDLIESIRRDFG